MYTATVKMALKQDIRSKTAIALAVILAGLAVTALTTDPQQLPLLLLLLPFLLIYVAFVLSLFLVTASLGVMARYRTKSKLLIAAIIAVLPFSLILFSSLHQLTARDVVISISLVCVISFYVSRADYLR